MLVLLHVLLLAAGLGALHLGLSRRKPFPLAAFVLAASGWHVVLGLGLLAPMLVGQARRSWLAAAWTPVLALGLFATGVVFALAWLGLIRGLALLAERRLARR